MIDDREVRKLVKRQVEADERAARRRQMELQPIITTQPSLDTWVRDMFVADLTSDTQPTSNQREESAMDLYPVGTRVKLIDFKKHGDYRPTVGVIIAHLSNDIRNNDNYCYKIRFEDNSGTCATWHENLKVEEEVIKKKDTKKEMTERFNMSEDNKGLSPTMGKMLAQVVMPVENKKAILAALIQENKDLRDKMFVEWGFDEVVEKGKGLTFLFFGPPGTGKTMCAQAIAEHLGRKHMILGAAELESPIPGQMERNVQEAFKKAKANKLLIVFDECDSLLYNRNHVGAIMGAQINCLLSEIEKFDGVCVLTTNRSSLLDPALERRIALKLEFANPDEKARKHIWGKLIPKKCPLHKDVKVDRLAKYELTGGEIKNVVLCAARTAIYAGAAAINMEHLEGAISKEKKGNEAFKGKKMLSKGGMMDMIDNVFTDGNKVRTRMLGKAPAATNGELA